MSNKNCGNCDYQGDFMTPQGIECLVDQKVHEKGCSCEDFKTHVPGKHLMVRLEQARAKREEREAKASEERRRESEEALAQKDSDCAKEIARIRMDYDAKLQEDRMRFERKQWKASWWWQTALVVIGAILGALLGIVGPLIVKALGKL